MVIINLRHLEYAARPMEGKGGVFCFIHDS